MMRHFTDEKGYAKEKVVIDGRTNVTPHEIGEYLGEARSGKRGYKKIFDLFQPNSVLYFGESPLITLLLMSGDWCLVYQDKKSKLKHTVMIKRAEYDSRPDDFPDAECEVEERADSSENEEQKMPI